MATYGQEDPSNMAFFSMFPQNLIGTLENGLYSDQFLRVKLPCNSLFSTVSGMVGMVWCVMVAIVWYAMEWVQYDEVWNGSMPPKVPNICKYGPNSDPKKCGFSQKLQEVSTFWWIFWLFLDVLGMPVGPPQR